MLKRKERSVFEAMLSYVFKSDGTCVKCLLSFDALLSAVNKKIKIENESLRTVLRLLEAEDYIEVIYTDRHGEPFLYLTLKKRGVRYKQELRENKNKLIFRLLLAVVSAIVTFVAGKILYAVFS